MEKIHFDPHGERPQISDFQELGIQPVKPEIGQEKDAPPVRPEEVDDFGWQPEIKKRPPIAEA